MSRAGPLDGVRVIEFGNLVAAPYCGMLLGDLGAEVIKVEPTSGDLARAIGPFINGESAFFMAVNRGKSSVAADPKVPAVAAALRRLVTSADVVVHNLRLGAMERMGLGPDDLMVDAPGLVYAVISAFGTTGPAAGRAGIDLVFQGESGMMSITGGEGEDPHKTATTIGDFVAGTNAAVAICAALVSRSVSGKGRLVEVSLRDGLIAVQAGWNAQFLATGRQPGRTGTASPVTAPNQTFRTGDGHINVAVVSDRHFGEVCRLLSLDDLVNDPRFADNASRVSNRRDLAHLIESVLVMQSTDHWMRLLGEAGLPVGRLLDLSAVFEDPQVLHNEMLVEMEHQTAGAIKVSGSPLFIDGEPARARRPPPTLGDESRSVLLATGLSNEEIDQLVADQAVVSGGW
ncbi:MAG TPA: CoA transferase [Acidimicrobiia bacterium]|nr:CoA transferase [Acidimicrobiia bacterium]